MPQLLKARTSDLLEMETDHELLIYDLRINKAYNLNETSKAVYRACGGNFSFEELKQRYKITDDLIHFALAELAACDLLEGEVVNHFAGLGRREVIRKVGLASMIALPVITGLTAPKAAAAASACRGSGSFSVGQSFGCANTPTTCQNFAPNNCRSCNATALNPSPAGCSGATPFECVCAA